ncbi:farnesol dehydrogenase-like isoform X2 [Cylas formicarius]|uniref:farnesol dehydrogenase-like isoform X2 n=1 Tax=Cylas formicarius TaxID=197179 RepID=UPI002958A330|nr:farnesol dehydrogenase-like isoform X2 [Cylas formicarius]
MILKSFARRKERVEQLATTLRGAKGKVIAVKCDMTIEDDILEAFKYVRTNLAPVSILINNAGILQATNLIDGDTEKWKTLLDTNILGLCIATREAMRDMKANNIDGHVIHINSLAGHRVYDYPQVNCYAASKHAVTALAETLRYEINRENLKVKITSISPGYVETDIVQAAFGTQAANFPLKKGLKSEDVADAVLYALSTPPHVQVSEVTIRLQGDNRN